MSMMPASGIDTVASPTRICAAPLSGAWARLIASTRASRMISASWRCRRAAVKKFASETESCTMAAAGTFISERTERTAEMRSTSQLISSAAAASSKVGCGHSVSTRSPGRSSAPSRAAFAHSSSLMNGMKGWSSVKMRSSTQTTVALVSSFSGPSAPASTGLASSRYQSQVWLQTKR